jgi:hypothetical protein
MHEAVFLARESVHHKSLDPVASQENLERFGGFDGRASSECRTRDIIEARVPTQLIDQRAP